MNSKLKTFGRIGLSLAEIMVPQVRVIEGLAKALPLLKGKSKQDAWIEIVKQSLEGAENITEKDLLDEPEVEAAARAVADSVVAFDNIVASVKAKRAAPSID
jgi:hypothetical protein